MLPKVSAGGGAVVAQLVADAVDDDHLPVEGVEGAEAEIALAEQFADGHFAVVDTVEESGHERVLKDRVPGHGTVVHGVQRSR
jgi:hypothetical protein